MEYARRRLITEFSFRKEYPGLSFKDKPQVINGLMDIIDSLDGREYFLCSSYLADTGYAITFYFYNKDDLLLARLAV